jgi:hypothetical protein
LDGKKEGYVENMEAIRTIAMAADHEERGGRLRTPSVCGKECY